jgi:predicted nucleic acid-binding protein
MIVLDTNVVSELMRPRPDAGVMAWIASRPASTLCTTTITQAEILHGVLVLPRGKRRDALEQAAEAMFDSDFAERLLPFTAGAARAYARIAAARRRAGRPISTLDAQIAAIARAAKSSLATRNVDDFDNCGIDVVDPWDGA